MLNVAAALHWVVYIKKCFEEGINVEKLNLSISVRLTLKVKVIKSFAKFFTPLTTH